MSRRLYAQLQPDEPGLKRLVELQQTIPQRGRLVSPRRIHMTVIHFGIVDEILAKLPCDPMTAHRSLTDYIDATEHHLVTLPTRTFDLEPIGVELFGVVSRTLVVTYRSTLELMRLHSVLLADLRKFFSDCGIDDVETFMKNDANFRHALSMTPHITLAKGYSGKLPLARELKPMRLIIMPFQYDQP